ncbi:MAG: hypothetical protein H8Z69_00460 [Nanohaloarchaea archaeon]|nr:hypothetical protein [Candidatus Nanohaloarchaea archaeon]
MKKGQIFILSAIVFASFILLTVYSFGNFVESGEKTYFKNYFSNSVDQPAKAFGSGLEKNSSVIYLEKKIYNTHRFLERQTSTKGIDYRGFDFAVLPYADKAMILNYGESLLRPGVKLDGSWSNLTLESKQSKEISLPEGVSNVRVTASSLDIDKSFNFSNPRIFVWSRMRDNGETWINSQLH